MDQEKIMNGLTKEIRSALKAMGKTKDPHEKEIYSRIIKNLCDSQGVFFNLASEMMYFDLDNEIDHSDVPF